MKELRCASLGYDCSWRHVATEALLADLAALHLRDVHDVAEIGPDYLARINTLFTDPSEKDADAAGRLTMKEYRCSMARDCTWRYFAMTEDLIAEGAAVHARDRHGIAEFTPQMIAKVKKSIHEWAGPSEEAKKAA